jgi:hypothetical protein
MHLVGDGSSQRRARRGRHRTDRVFAALET